MTCKSFVQAMFKRLNERPFSYLSVISIDMNDLDDEHTYSVLLLQLYTSVGHHRRS